MALNLEKYRDLGLLVLRVGIGLMFVTHGYPKLFGGVEKWSGLGSVMKMWGIDFYPVVWGFLASASEFVGGLLLVAGFFFRPACFFLFATMLVATSMHLGQGDGLKGASHAIEAGILFLSLILIGPGKYSIQKS